MVGWGVWGAGAGHLAWRLRGVGRAVSVDTGATVDGCRHTLRLGRPSALPLSTEEVWS